MGVVSICFVIVVAVLIIDSKQILVTRHLKCGAKYRVLECHINHV